MQTSGFYSAADDDYVMIGKSLLGIVDMLFNSASSDIILSCWPLFYLFTNFGKQFLNKLFGVVVVHFWGRFFELAAFVLMDDIKAIWVNAPVCRP